MEGEYSCYGGGQFNRGRKVMFSEVVTFNGGKIVMLQRLSL